MNWLKCIVATIVAPVLGAAVGFVLTLLVMYFQSARYGTPGDGMLAGLLMIVGFGAGLMWAANYFNNARMTQDQCELTSNKT